MPTKKKHHKQMSRADIIYQCSKVALHRRTADRSSWTAINIVVGYSLMVSQHLEGEEIAAITSETDALCDKIASGEADASVLSSRLMDFAKWTVNYEPFTEADITAKKGTLEYFLQARQVESGNVINQFSSEFMIAFFNVLIDKGYDVEKLTAVKDATGDLFAKYSDGSLSVKLMERELEDETGLVFEHPKDPLAKD